MFQAFGSLADAAAAPGPRVVTIGNFDGVHLGHRRILEEAKSLARARGWKAAVLTFDPHPTRVVAPERAPELMTTIEQRLERFAELGLDEALVLPFDADVARLSPEEFARDVLADALEARAVVVGSNFRFGHKHAGDVETLRALGLRYGFECVAVAPLMVDAAVVSSSRVRAALGQGRLREARRLLGRSYAMRGAVASGRGIGGSQTVPTLNLDPDCEMTPLDGVYVTWTRDLDSGRCWRSVSNVGVRPTFGSGARVVETHLLDPLEAGPPRRIEVTFLRRLREERTFASAPDLKRQIVQDIHAANRFFALLDELS
ncbi:MAG: bifunctional riboflavin kinase/FAD synthetase [Bryobacterales bacterium]|nr:bifunctional riboflavin kinase/FAD synthetase [Bryobacterales bacterium]